MNEGPPIPNPFDQLDPMARMIADAAVDANQIAQQIPLDERGTGSVLISFRGLSEEDGMIGMSAMLGAATDGWNYTSVTDVYYAPEFTPRVLDQMGVPYNVLTQDEFFAEWQKKREENK